MIFDKYIHSLSHQDVLNLSTVLMNTLLVILIGILGMFGYELYDSYTNNVIPKLHIKSKEQINSTEHIHIEYRTDSFEIEIHHFTNPPIAEFLRQLKELQIDSCSYYDLTLQSIKLIECMKYLDHPNMKDVLYAFDVLLDSNEYAENTVQHVLRWLHIAKLYWMLYPEDAMLPLEFNVRNDELSTTERTL